MWSWGDDSYGQLGNGDVTGDEEGRPEPVRVKRDANSYLTDIASVDAGRLYSLAIDKYGRIWVWGDNYYGQLGLGYRNKTNPEPYARMMVLP